VRPYLEKPCIKIGLLEWFKVKALSSNSNTTKTNKTKQKNPKRTGGVAQVEERLLSKFNPEY
jgi:hypothetical protein